VRFRQAFQNAGNARFRYRSIGFTCGALWVFRPTLNLSLLIFLPVGKAACKAVHLRETEIAEHFRRMFAGMTVTAIKLRKTRRSGRDCRNPEARDGDSFPHPCGLDTGNPCRYDSLT
jgi:hypothetical protein